MKSLVISFVVCSLFVLPGAVFAQTPSPAASPLAVASPAAGAPQDQVPSAQPQKMISCVREAAAKGLTGVESTTYINTCRNADTSAAANKETQPEKIMRCNREAAAKGLQGAARTAFMMSCQSHRN